MNAAQAQSLNCLKNYCYIPESGSQQKAEGDAGITEKFHITQCTQYTIYMQQSKHEAVRTITEIILGCKN